MYCQPRRLTALQWGTARPDYSSTTVQYVLYCSMIGLSCILNTRADRQPRGRTSTNLSRTHASGQAYPAYSRTGSHQPVSSYGPSGHGTREHASEPRSASARQHWYVTQRCPGASRRRSARPCARPRLTPLYHHATRARSPGSVRWGCVPSPISVYRRTVHKPLYVGSCLCYSGLPT